MRAILATATALLLSVGCSCNRTEGPRFAAPRPAPPSDVEPEPAPSPFARLETIESAPVARPATRVEVGLTRTSVDNGALVETWPAGDLGRAVAAAPDGEARWPRVDRALPPLAPGDAIPERLASALERTRAAERSATGSGRGASRVGLLVDARVPFGVLERAIRATTASGYAAPELIVGPEGDERALPWPSGSRDLGLTEADLRAALAGAALPTHAREGEARLDVLDDRVDARLDGSLQAPGCADATDVEAAMTFAEAPPAVAVGRCLEMLRERGAESLTLAIAPGIATARVAPLLSFARAFEHARVISLAAGRATLEP